MSLDWRTLPSLAALRAFEATARHGGFSGAARALNVTHAAVAQQVRALESDLGLKLVVREGRAMQLTDTGRSLALGLGTGFTTIAETLTSLRAAEARRGIRVTTTSFITEAVIMPQLGAFWEAHPGVEIALLPIRDYVDIEKEGFDFAIRAVFEGGRHSWPGTDAIHLANSHVVCAGAPELVGTATADPYAHPWLWHDNNDSKRTLIREAGLDLDLMTLVHIGGASLQLEAVRRGLGITLVNERVAREDLAQGRLVEVEKKKKKKKKKNYFALLPLLISE